MKKKRKINLDDDAKERIYYGICYVSASMETCVERLHNIRLFILDEFKNQRGNKCG